MSESTAPVEEEVEKPVEPTPDGETEGSDDDVPEEDKNAGKE